MRTTWEMAAMLAGKTILTFEDPMAFEKQAVTIAKNIPIYIDSDLGNGIKGEVYAKQLYEQGFTKLYLATGFDASLFESMPWIKQICGKQPPF